jgi:hypothetical protein
MSEAPKQPKQEEKHNVKKPWFERGAKMQGRGIQQQKKKDPTEIPILRYGLNNNFSKFKETLSYQAMKQFGDLGRLIELGTYYEPIPPDLDDYDFTP